MEFLLDSGRGNMELLPNTSARPQSWSHGLVRSEGRNHLMTAKVKILSIFMFISKPLRRGVIVPCSVGLDFQEATIQFSTPLSHASRLCTQ